MKKGILTAGLMCLLLLLGGCGLFAVQESGAVGKYYLAANYDPKGRNMVQDVTAAALRLRRDGSFILENEDAEYRGSWELSGGEISLKYGRDRFPGTLEDETIRLEFGIFVKGRAEAEAYRTAHRRIISASAPPIETSGREPWISGYEGTYYIAYQTIGGAVSRLKNPDEIRLILLPDGEAILSLPVIDAECQYTLAEGRLILYWEGLAYSGTAVASCLRLKNDLGDEMIFFAGREEAARYLEDHRPATVIPTEAPTVPPVPETPPETTPETPADTTEAPPETEPAEPDWTAGRGEGPSFWNGTWYGFVTVTDGSTGIYRLMRGKSYAVYLTVSMDENGSGSFVIYDPLAVLAEKLVGGSCTGLTRDALDAPTVTVYPLKADFPGGTLRYDADLDLVTLEMTLSTDSGKIAGAAYLRPWGRSWEDVPASVTDRMPDYERYRREVESSERPPYPKAEP